MKEIGHRNSPECWFDAVLTQHYQRRDAKSPISERKIGLFNQTTLDAGNRSAATALAMEVQASIAGQLEKRLCVTEKGNRDITRTPRYKPPNKRLSRGPNRVLSPIKYRRPIKTVNGIVPIIPVSDNHST
jgi:hypothetical protein